MRLFATAALATVLTAPALAGPDAFHPGSLIPEFGNVAAVDTTVDVPETLRLSFDTATEAEPGELHRTLTSAARFLNMHAEAGVDPANINLAVVVHGRAVRDVANADVYGAAHDGAENANEALIAALVAQGVRIYVCGQSAAYYDVGTGDLQPGVDMALSAMTAHAMLQAEGYAINPF
ncbi:DsrE family protein [Hyphobacterium marinum]|uniref:DsrE family protein n=1 Tax=Hyphobacterium marinum TaxID=3116574 RepID=A0ABU7M2B8_9PROT|nr:DsrE family protein [Hyphobacterium sp. Y6023]MEE2567420.1 DsrE family protein [Hyphobacterium sp. Y6023]